MVFPVVGGTQDTSYEIENSLRFDDSNYLTRDNTTQSGGGTNFTFSAWLKMSTFGSGGYQGIFSIFKDSNDYFEIYKDNGNGAGTGSENLQICQNINGTNVCYQIQDFEFADYSAWYHLVVNFNNSESNQVDKVSIYVNGTEIAGAVSNSNPFDDVGLGDSAYDTRVGAYRDNTSATWNGYMADVHLIAGQTLAASYFGETDDNGVWIPKKYLGTFGANGFKLEFKQTGTSQNSSGMGADTSGEDNHLAVTGLSSIDVTVDTPTNNFATLNPIGTIGVYNQQQTAGISSGNLEIPRSRNSGESDGAATANIAFPTNGKWYYEFKWASRDAGSAWAGLTTHIDASKNVIYYAANGNSYVDNSSASYGDTYTVGDIISVAVNKDDNQVTFYKNGTSQGTLTNNSLDDYDFFAYFSDGGGSDGPNYQVNFGNPIHSISSGNSDANGYGNFEYAVPSGYYALCTKNLAEYG